MLELLTAFTLTKMASRLRKIEGDESVLLRVTHSNLKTFSADIRFSLQSSVESVKDKLWRKCGTSVDSMSLHLYDDANTQVSILNDNSKPLGFYSPHDGSVHTQTLSFSLLLFVNFDLVKFVIFVDDVCLKFKATGCML